jgi:hypothetical protein
MNCTRIRVVLIGFGVGLTLHSAPFAHATVCPMTWEYVNCCMGAW